MTQTPPPGGRSAGQYGGQPGPQGADTFFTGLRRIDMRRSDDSWIGGVCAGLADRLGVDPLVIRALFVVLSLGMGLGVMLYLAAWLLIPGRQEETHIEQALRDGRAESVVLLVVTVLALFGSFGWFGTGWWFEGSFFGWGVLSLVVLGLGAWWLWSEWSKREQPGFYGERVRQYAGPSTQHTAPPFADSTGDTSASFSGGGATAWTPGPAATSVGQPVPGVTTSSGDWQPPPRAPKPPPSPKPPPAPRRPGRRSAGVAGTLLGLGLALTAGGGLAWAAAEYDWSVNPFTIGVIGALGALGLVILILGFAGRTSGFPGFLAICALLATGAVLPISDNFVPSGRVGDQTWRPAVVAGDVGPYRLGAGTGTLDLRGLDDQDLTEVIEVSVSFGQLTILVPEGLTVQIDAGTGMGAISRPGINGDLGGVSLSEEFVVGDGPVDLEVEARVGFGQIVVEGGQ